VVTDPAQVSTQGIEGPPALLVEVLSPSTRDYDQTTKARRYAALGVRHFWVVDPEQRRLSCYRAEAGGYTLVAAGEGDGALVHPDWPDLTLALAALWR
jgi:Uma2 family endonuclease